MSTDDEITNDTDNAERTPAEPTTPAEKPPTQRLVAQGFVDTRYMGQP